MSSIKSNIFYSSILTCAGYLFPLLTFPYVTRVLGVSGVGITNFVDSIVQYFIVLSTMGIMTVGIREIASAKTNKQLLSQTFSSLLFLNMLASLISIICLLVSVLSIPSLYEYKFLFYIGASKILANTLSIEWFFKGIEDFKYITIRSVIIRAIYVISVFVFVKDNNDYTLYFALTTLTYVASACINTIYSKKFVRFTFCFVNLRCLLRPFLVLGLYSILTSFYSTFNVAFLGLATDTTQVGYYTTATKLYAIILSFYSAFTGVMMPRMSALVSNGEIDEFKRLIAKSLNILVSFSVPLLILSEICAPEIIYIVAGDGYAESVTPMRIVLPLMLIIGYEQILVLQILTPLKKDREILINSILGAMVTIVFSFILVQKLGCVGTAIVWVMSETTVLLSSIYFVNKSSCISYGLENLIRRALTYIPILLFGLFLSSYFTNAWIKCLVIAIYIFTCFIIVECIIFKNDLIRHFTIKSNGQ